MVVKTSSYYHNFSTVSLFEENLLLSWPKSVLTCSSRKKSLWDPRTCTSPSSWVCPECHNTTLINFTDTVCGEKISFRLWGTFGGPFLKMSWTSSETTSPAHQKQPGSLTPRVSPPDTDVKSPLFHGANPIYKAFYSHLSAEFPDQEGTNWVSVFLWCFMSFVLSSPPTSH